MVGPSCVTRSAASHRCLDLDDRPEDVEHVDLRRARVSASESFGPAWEADDADVDAGRR